MSATFKIEGERELIAAITVKEALLRKNLLRIAVAGTLGLEKYAKREAPVDTGRLRADIHSEFKASTMKGEVRSGRTVGYAVPVHEGHRTRSGSTVAGNPYLIRALRRQEPETEAALRDLKSRL